MAWKPEVIADSSGKWCNNGLSFATYGEAMAWVQDRAERWTLVRDTRAVEIVGPPADRWDERQRQAVRL